MRIHLKQLSDIFSEQTVKQESRKRCAKVTRKRNDQLQLLIWTGVIEQDAITITASTLLHPNRNSFDKKLESYIALIKALFDERDSVKLLIDFVLHYLSYHLSKSWFPNSLRNAYLMNMILIDHSLKFRKHYSYP